MADQDRLTERLAEIRARHPGSQPEIVAEVVTAVLATMSGDLTAQETSLLAEVEALGRTIASAKVEIAALVLSLGVVMVTIWDGVSSRFRGILLIAAYVGVAAMFFVAGDG